ncbi:Alpha/beta hydrolase-3 [Melia azedarach]|uniref:Alpha/beta hydrolase-3 n=1 Tax=Melia azedarach TaxID=155640 RepID=A0ACC1XVW1_MELAZ|nr:Alpha/beta hydrolase-3 [Melia azedarach]
MTTTNSDQHSSPSPATKPSIPWKTRLVLTLASALTDTCRRNDGTINRRFMNVLDVKSPPNPNPVNFVSTSDITVDADRRLWFRLFTPTAPSAAENPSLPVIVFFHGGGFTFLTAASKSYDAVCRRFARKLPAFVVSVNYRLCPEHRYPSQYDDGLDVLKFLDENHDAVFPKNADLSKCFLAGDSAGANLAHHVAVRGSTSQFRVLKIVGLISIQPFFGGEERTEAENRLVGSPLVSVSRTDWIWKVFLPDGSNRDHAAANVSGPNAMDISGLEYPDTVVFVGGFDPLQDWQRRYYEWLKKSGKDATLIEYPNMIHAFYVFPELPEASQLIAQVKDFVSKRLSKI